jgi:hypothetical protein
MANNEGGTANSLDRRWLALLEAENIKLKKDLQNTKVQLNEVVEEMIYTEREVERREKELEELNKNYGKEVLTFVDDEEKLLKKEEERVQVQNNAGKELDMARRQLVVYQEREKRLAALVQFIYFRLISSVNELKKKSCCC